ncbi:GNAT family N-acetyltransferase [Kribbella italica]|uniref:Putative acetyltransferase n=1 Tax=Kribbella italica TaxID=1540520 RepID=A0A7W9J2M4_9ACTN|nr:GNAT family N-acetyltransferase [Kribbella italica]MBB5833922.1 putative acetyltransferase [Kribbella italica]
MPELIQPTVDLRDSWLESSLEWGSESQHGSGLHESDDVGSVEGFAAWVGRLAGEGDETRELAPGRVPAAYWWIVDDGKYAGAITLRYRLNDKLLDGGGHIGYGVRPSARRRGLASWALGAVLDRARERGLERVLVTCDDDNAPSACTIERHGGVLEDVRETWLGLTRRYWIAL